MVRLLDKTYKISIIGVLILGVFLCGCTSVDVAGANMNVIYTGATSGYLGPTSQSISKNDFKVSGGGEFTETLTLRSSALLLTHSINSISIPTGGFIVESVTPQLPYSFSPGSSMMFTLKVKAPDQNFDGPINIVVTTS
jgi:hypothetical protein